MMQTKPRVYKLTTFDIEMVIWKVNYLLNLAVRNVTKLM